MSERLTIALVILHADPTRGGAERYTHDLATALANEHTVSLLATSFLATSFAESTPAGVQRVPLDAEGLTRKRRYHSFLDSLDSHLAHHPYDIVHAMLPVRHCDLYHPHAGLASRSIDEARGWKRLNNRLNPRRGAFAEVERRLLATPDAPTLLCLSQRMRNEVIDDGIARPDRTVVLFNAVDLQKFDPGLFPHHPSDRLRALIIAQDFARKGLKPAMEAIAQCTDWSLTVVGKDDAAPYRRLTQSLGIENRVTFAGPLTDVRPMYQQADVFILPTHHDPCSLVVLEALAMGVPVISTRANGACEIMTDGEHGFVIDEADHVSAIVKSLRTLSDSQRRAVISKACLALRPKLSFDSHVKTLMQIASRR